MGYYVAHCNVSGCKSEEALSTIAVPAIVDTEPRSGVMLEILLCKGHQDLFLRRTLPNIPMEDLLVKMQPTIKKLLPKGEGDADG